MKIDFRYYNFFFHPFHEEHSRQKKVASIITNIFLSVTVIYALIFLGFRCLERKFEVYLLEGTSDRESVSFQLSKYVDLRNWPYNFIPNLPCNHRQLCAASKGLVKLQPLPSKLRLLDVAMNRLEELPELPASLECLDASHNQLSELPSLSSKLENLSVKSNRLRELPQLPASLRELNVSSNQLRELRELPASLRELNVSSNQLSNLPPLPSELKSLFVCDNQLGELPELPANLTELDVTRNQLSNLPPLPKSLRFINICNNLFTELPDFVLTLSSDTRIDAQHNRFSAEYVELFQRRLQQHRLSHPGEGPHVAMSIYEAPQDNQQGLSQILKFWKTEYVKGYQIDKYPIDFYNSLNSKLDANSKDNLTLFLNRLREIPDYKSQGNAKKNVIGRIEKMLRLACENDDFRSEMLESISHALNSCGDRVLIYFNEIEIIWQMYQPQTEEQRRDLCLRAQKYKWLEGYATSLNTTDKIETILYLQLKLKERFNFPITTETMLYSRCSGISDFMLETAEKTLSDIADDVLLQQSLYWQAYSCNKNKEKAKEINEKYEQLIEEAETYFNLTEKEKVHFLKDPTPNELRSILLDFQKDHRKLEYDAVCRYISVKREEEIAKL